MSSFSNRLRQVILPHRRSEKDRHGAILITGKVARATPYFVARRKRTK